MGMTKVGSHHVSPRDLFRSKLGPMSEATKAGCLFCMSTLVLLRSASSAIVDHGISELESQRLNVPPSLRDRAYHHFDIGKIIV